MDSSVLFVTCAGDIIGLMSLAVYRQRLQNETCPANYVTSCIGARKQNNFQDRSILRGVYMFKVTIKDMKANMLKVKCMFKINVLLFFYNFEDISQLILIFLMLNLNM